MIDKLTAVPSNWQPEQNKVRLAVLGKLIEELTECAGASARCIIQGFDEHEPVTHKPNREWLEQEVADVQALLTLTINTFDLDGSRIAERREMKLEHKKAWLRLLCGEPMNYTPPPQR